MIFMNYINLEKNIIKLWLVLVIIVSLILSIASISSYTYLTGFLLGSIVSISTFLANNVFFGKLLSTKKTFKKTFFITFLKFLLTSCLIVGTLISVIFINKTVNKSNNSMLNIDGIFNFFALLAGLLTIQFSIIFYHILIFINEHIKKKGQHGSNN